MDSGVRRSTVENGCVRRLRWCAVNRGGARVLAALLFPLAFGCTEESSPSTTGLSAGPNAEAGTSPADEMSASSAGSESGSSDGQSSDGAGSSASGDSGSTSAASGADATIGNASSDGGASDQPTDGQYSHCDETDMVCGGNADACVTITFGGMADGFCSVRGCTDPVADCDPTPGGTATPFCLPGMDNMGSTAFCALACDPGECPSGMLCASVSFDGGEPASVCT